MSEKVMSAGSIEVPLGIRAKSYDPSIMPRPAFIRETAHIGNVQVGCRYINARLVMDGGVRLASKTFTVADNDFSTGGADILLGDYDLHSHIDFRIGETAEDTAANIAEAISHLSGFSATVDGADVTVWADSPADVIEFHLFHRGEVINFVSTGGSYFDAGSPRIGV